VLSAKHHEGKTTTEQRIMNGSHQSEKTTDKAQRMERALLASELSYRRLFEAARDGITDVIMPIMSGKVMAEWLKTANADLKILFTSGYTSETIERGGLFETGVDFLPKPYTPSTLACKIREMLDLK
jgi:DNA-binding response OmpR family regulator